MNKIILLISLFLFASIANSLTITDKNVDFGYKQATGRAINTIIIHSTFNNSGGGFYDIDLVIKQFKQYNVSAHYVIGRDGSVFRLVNEQNIAYHAGKGSLPNGKTDINSCSIGIELMTSYTESPTEIQIETLVELVNDIKNRYSITYILRHSDIAPTRKTDPWNMDWESFLQKINFTN